MEFRKWQSNLFHLPIERTQQLVDTSHDVVLVRGGQFIPIQVIIIREKLTMAVATGDAFSHVLNLNLQRPATSGTAFYKVTSSYHLGTSCYLETSTIPAQNPMAKIKLPTHPQINNKGIGWRQRKIIKCTRKNDIIGSFYTYLPLKRRCRKIRAIALIET